MTRPPGSRPPETARRDESPTVKLASAVISQVAIVTALLYYFGWARTKAAFEYFGLDTSVVGLSAEDYLLRSVGAVAPVVAVGLATVVVTVSARRLFGRRMPDWPPRVLRLLHGAGRVGRVLCWLCLVGVLVVLIVSPPGNRLLSTSLPVLFLVAAAALAYADVIRADALGRHDRDHASLRFRSKILGGLCIVGVFWSLSVYAYIEGNESAERTRAALYRQPGIVLYSAERLTISSPIVTETPVTAPDHKFGFVYRGLHLLIKTPEKYFLIPDDWDQDHGAVIVIADDDSIRVDVIKT